MTVKIRLARIGGRHNPLYRINVANSWARRDGRHIEALGEYHAIPDELGVKRISLDFARTRYWLSVGAQPTDTVARLLALVLARDVCAKTCGSVGRSLAIIAPWRSAHEHGYLPRTPRTGCGQERRRLAVFSLTVTNNELHWQYSLY